MSIERLNPIPHRTLLSLNKQDTLLCSSEMECFFAICNLHELLMFYIDVFYAVFMY